MKVFIVFMVDWIGPLKELLDLYLGGPMIEQRVVARNAEGICVFKEKTLDRGDLAFEAFLAFDVLGCKWRGATLGLGTLRTTRVQPSEVGEFLEVVCIMFGVMMGDLSCI